MHYQSILSRGGSDSAEKLKSLNIPPLNGKSFLDVGCNEGFFCGAALAAGADQVNGVDSNPDFISRAREFFPSVQFHAVDWNEFLPRGEADVDVVLCSSAMHYADDQEQFLRALMRRVKLDGCLILECGLGEGEGDYVEQERWDGTRRYFTKRYILEFIRSEGHHVFRFNPSVLQAGDALPRYVLHIRRVSPNIIVNFDPSGSGKTTIAERIGSALPTVQIDLIALKLIESLNSQFMLSLSGEIGTFWLAMEQFGFAEPAADMIVKAVPDSGIHYLEGYLPPSIARLVLQGLRDRALVVHQLSLASDALPTKAVASIKAMVLEEETYVLSSSSVGYIDRLRIVRGTGVWMLVAEGWHCVSQGREVIALFLPDEGINASFTNRFPRGDLPEDATGFAACFDVTEQQALAIRRAAIQKRSIQMAVETPNRVFAPIEISSSQLQRLEHFESLVDSN